jgi:hypothetical protein
VKGGGTVSRAGRLKPRGYARTEELAQRLPGWAALVAQISAVPTGLEDLSAVLHYLLRVGDRSAQDVTVGMLKSAVGAQRTEELMAGEFEEYFERWSQKVRLEAQARGRAEGQALGRAEGQALGRAEAKADSILRILAARGVHVDDLSRQRIMSCADMATLDRWFDLSLNATRLSDVLGDLAQ